MTTDTTTRTLLALCITVAAVALGAGGAVAAPADADGGELSTDDPVPSGDEVCEAVFGGPHLGWWCKNTVGDTVDEASP